MATVFKSKEPCFICRKAEKTVQMKNGENNVVLCVEHFIERLEEKPKAKKKAEKKQ